ncbi:hypothetical protein EC973_002521 [Apophysomyces ossiformis]|uniref:HTH APSES-type domain-containing protein n=1 Tax=Apophysomyces ossiformis TaxID=679940 RepID=A0A8H7BU68_9FUNG|nr:hypothetical protein EC973_002521 [Apophysomyces ossiformis]
MDNANTENDCPRFRPFATSHRLVKVKKAKYSTSLDSRGYIPVYEYAINGQPIMWDRESGYVHFTGIWKSLGNSKADIVKMVDSNPELKVKKIRGGFLKIQGTWIPYDYAYTLCKRTAWNVRRDLVAMFGPRFVNEALDPSHPEYGCLLLDPKSAPYHKGAAVQRRSASFSTMRGQPYKRDYMRRREKKSNKIAKRMSVSRLLNESGQEDDKESASPSGSTESPETTPSPTFRVIPTFSDKWQHHHQQQQQQQQAPPPSPPPTTTSTTTATTATTSIPTNASVIMPPPPPSSSSQRQKQQAHSGPLLPPIYTTSSPSMKNNNSSSHPSPNNNNNSSNNNTTTSATTSNGNSSSSTTTTTVTSATINTSLLPPPSCLKTPSREPRVTPVSNWTDSAAISQDIIETINATILLQCLSMDDGARPFRPVRPELVPSKVIVGNQEFRICWDN